MKDIWHKARRKPLLVQYREVYSVRGGKNSNKEIIKTREGTLIAVRGRDFVIKGVEGELYPITKTTFLKTYDPVPESVDTEALKCPPGFDVKTNCNEKCPKWRCW